MVFIAFRASHSENSGIYQLIFLPFHILFRFLLIIHSSSMTCAFQLLLKLSFQISSFLSFVKLFTLGRFIIDIVFSLVPLFLIKLLSLLPSPRSILIIQIPISHVLALDSRFAEFSSGKDLAGLVFRFIWFSDDCVSTKDNGTRTVGPLRHCWMLWLGVITWARSRWLWFLPVAHFWLVFVISVVGGGLVLSRLRKGPWWHLIYYKFDNYSLNQN